MPCCLLKFLGMGQAGFADVDSHHPGLRLPQGNGCGLRGAASGDKNPAGGLVGEAGPERVKHHSAPDRVAIERLKVMEVLRRSGIRVALVEAANVSHRRILVVFQAIVRSTTLLRARQAEAFRSKPPITAADSCHGENAYFPRASHYHIMHAPSQWFVLFSRDTHQAAAPCVRWQRWRSFSPPAGPH